MRESIAACLKKAFDGNRLAGNEALALLRKASPLELGHAADAVRRRHHPEGIATYIVDRNINYTNVCVSRCRFCAFYREAGDPEAFVLSREELHRKISETVSLGGTGILLQGGHNPDLPFCYYEEMLEDIRASFPGLHVHGFSPPEITFFSKQFSLPVADVIERLRSRGLGSIPGGGAEILSQGVRARMAPGKATVEEWLGVMREAHRQGLRTTATMMFGSIETDEEVVDHLEAVRYLQDETGGFTAFIPWTFQPGPETPIKESTATGIDYLKLLAVSRIFLDNFENVQASWVTQGLKMGQVALHFGANDIGSVMIEENVVAAAGCRNHTNEEELRHVIAQAGFTPRKRTTLYDIFEESP